MHRPTPAQSFTRASLAWTSALGALLFSVAAMVPGCGDDTSAGTGCNAEGAAACAQGQACITGSDGKAACYCNTEADSGCDNGQQCLADANGDPACYCNTETDGGCADGTVCEAVVGGYPACFPPVSMAGMVFDLATDAPIEGAVVVARDANFAAVSGLATTDASGNYTLVVPTPRNADGSLVAYQVFLRADAQTYLSFPTAPRVALPIEMSTASGDPPLVDTAATDIGMIKLASTTGLGTVTGTVVADVPIGTLVVAGGAAMTGGGVTGIAGHDGTYTVFNVPAGNVTVSGYKAGLQLTPASAAVTADAVTSGVDLLSPGAATAVVSGKVEIVNPGNGSDTSVILVVDETFVPNAARGEAPPGLRAHPVSGTFTIADVPDGNYVVLAAFENDFLVRDPDTSIGGTSLVRITVSGASVDIAEGFKITGSLDDVSPDGEEVVTGTPQFSWADDSGEDHYEIRVFDAYGTMVWEKTDVPGVSGGALVVVDYAGPALTSGLIYQFRAISIKNGGTPISITEDLKGVFLYQ